MVLPNLFTRSSAKKKKSDNDKEDPARNTDSPPPSPTKKSPTKSKRDRESGPASPHSSWSYSKSSNSPRYTYDRSSHPLNLPPHELRRLSALSAMSDPPTPMDLDQDEDGPTSSLPSSPPPAMSPGVLLGTNGANGVNGVNSDGSPVPPPHKIPSSPPPQPKPIVDAEACKAAGNKFFKAKDYDKAIKEYTKGANISILYGTFLGWNFGNLRQLMPSLPNSCRSRPTIINISLQPFSGLDLRKSLQRSSGRCKACERT